MALPGTNVNYYTGRVNNAAKIFDEHGDFIRSIISYQVRNETRVDDIFQDFFLALVTKPPPPDVQNIKGYLYKMIVNDVIDAFRRVERYQNKVHKYGEQLNYSINKNCPENAFIKIEEANKMFELVEKLLPQRQAQAVTLRYRDNHNIKEVAARMDVNERSVSRYISVGFSRIRRFLTVKTRG